jgi:hypothetical protein
LAGETNEEERVARAIVRWSITGEKSNESGNEIVEILTANGFVRVGTASYESDDQPLPKLFDTMRRAMAVMQSPVGGGNLDHFWVYVSVPEGASRRAVRASKAAASPATQLTPKA